MGDEDAGILAHVADDGSDVDLFKPKPVDMSTCHGVGGVSPSGASDEDLFMSDQELVKEIEEDLFIESDFAIESNASSDGDARMDVDSPASLEFADEDMHARSGSEDGELLEADTESTKHPMTSTTLQYVNRNRPLCEQAQVLIANVILAVRALPKVLFNSTACTLP